MASVHVSMGPTNSGLLPIMSPGARKETITSSAANAQGALIAQLGDVAKINCATAVIVQSGAAASASSGIYLAAGETGWIAMNAGDRINVIDA